MPYYPQIGDLIQARVVCYTPSQISINTIHLRRTNSIPVGTGASLEELAITLDTAYAPRFKALMSSEAKYRGVGCKVITSPQTIEYFTVANDGVGGLVSELLPTQVTYVIQKRTVWGGRANIGRIFPGFPPQVAVDPNGVMAAAFAATVDALAAEFNAGLPVFGVSGATGDTDFTYVLKHAGGTAFTDIDNFVGSDKFATQRRRGQYGKTNILPF